MLGEKKDSFLSQEFNWYKQSDFTGNIFTILIIVHLTSSFRKSQVMRFKIKHPPQKVEGNL